MVKTRFASLAVLIAAVVSAALIALAPRAARAETGAGKGSFSTVFASRYVWRGQILSDGLVAQPAVTVASGGFAASLWSNADLDNDLQPDDTLVMNETDLTLSYTTPVGPASLTGGWIYYDFDGADTHELYLTCALPVLLNPSLSLYYDIDEGRGGFAVLAVSQAIPVGTLSLTAGASLGVNIDDRAMGANADGEKFTGLYYSEVSLATSIPLFGKVTLDPRIAYSTALGGDGKNAIEAVSVDGDSAAFYGSIAITAAF